MSFGAGLIAPSSAATSAAAATAAATTGELFLPVAAVAASVGLVIVSVNLLLQAELQQRGGRGSSKLRASWPPNVRGFGQRGL